MDDINAELDAFLATIKGQDPANGAAGTALQRSGKQLENELPPVEVPQAAPPANAGPAPEPAFDINSELDAFLQSSSGMPATEAPRALPVEQPAEPTAPGWGEVVSGGVQRGVAQLASAPADLAGIAAAAGGDQALAQEAFEKARAIESYAPKGYYNFEDIHDFDSFAGWMVEGLAEQAPVLAAVLTGGGIGAVGTRLVAKGLIKNPAVVAKLTTAGAATGAGTVGIGLETAGAGSEFKQRTGDYNPERSLAVGVANGILEAYGPAKLFAAGAKKFGTEVLLGAAREGSTEFAQELNTAANAAWIDENYDFFSRETALRLGESTLLGTGAGGAVTAGVRGLQKATGTEPEEIDYDDAGSWRTGLTALRDKYLTRKDPNNDNVLQVPLAAKEDVLELSPVLNGVRKTWEREGVLSDNIEQVREFEDAVTDRYVVQGPDGKWGSELLTATDIEETLAAQPQALSPKVMKVDLRSLAAGGITADPFDLPVTANDKRIFFAPWVKPENRQALLKTYEQLGQYVEAAQTNRLVGGPSKADARQAIMDRYAPLAAQGLRVIPSRGSSFIYKGEFEGQEVDRPEFGSRSKAVMLVPRGSIGSTDWSGKVLRRPVDVPIQFNKTVENTGYVPISVDTSKVGFDDYLSLPMPGELAPTVDAYNFREGLTEEQKQQLAKEYYEKVGAGYASQNTVNTEKLLIDFKARGIQIKPERAYALQLAKGFGKDKLKSLVVGRYTPGENKGPDLWRKREGKLPLKPVSVKGQLLINPAVVKNATAQEKRIIEAIKKLAPKMQELTKQFGLPPLTIRVERTGGGLAMDMSTGEMYLELDSFLKPFKVGANDTVDITDNKAVEASVALVMLHELGHYVAAQQFRNLPYARQQDIIYGYEKARLRNSLMGGDTSTAHGVLTSKYREFQPTYVLTFNEYLAEQFRRFATSTEILNESGKFYSLVGKQVKEMAKRWEADHGADVALNLQFPAWEFYSAMRYLETVERENTAYEHRKQQTATILKSQFGLAETIPVVEESTQFSMTVELVNEWRKALPANVDVQVLEGRGPGNKPAEYVNNDPLTGRAAIRLWVGSMRNPATSNPVAHEATHAVWDLLTPGERNILVRAGRREKVMPGGFEAKYFRDYKEQLKRLGFNEQEANVGARQYVDEEYAAWLIGKRHNGVDYGPEVNRIVDAILELFRKVGNLLLGNGWNSVNEISRSLMSGEIAGRVSRRAAPPPSVVKSQYGDGETDGDYRLHKLGGNIYAIESILWDGQGREFLFVRYNGPVKGSLEAQLSRVNGGERIGKIDLSHVSKLGYEVDMVDIVERFRYKNSKVDYSDQFYNFLGQYLKQEMRPSGILYDPGYRMWKRRNPASVAYHQKYETNMIGSEEKVLWYSPKRILKYMLSFKMEVERQAKSKGIPENKTTAWAEYSKYKKMYDAVPKEAWTDPGFNMSFMTGSSSNMEWEAYVGMLEKEGRIADNRFEKAVTGAASGPTTSAFELAVAEAQDLAKKENARKLGVDLDVAAPGQVENNIAKAIFDRWGINNPQLNPMLSGAQMGSEMDRINWFTKLAISIKQMAWNNPHIQQLRDYVAAKDEMNALRMKWVERAEETVRGWDTLPSRQRDLLSDLLFWSTEMRYLGPNDPPRLPTPNEVAAEAARLGMAQEAVTMYYQVQRDFSDYLVEVERVLTENITRQNQVVGPNGVVSLSQAGQAAIASLRADMAAMRMRPYFPMVRFGEYTVTIRDPAANNEVVWFSAHPTLRERDAAAQQIIRRFPAHSMQVGKMEPDVMQFQGMPPALLRAIKANLPGLTQQQADAIDEFALQMAPERSFRKRWLRRNGTQGYSLDAMRVYSHYFQGGSGYLAKLAYKPAMDEAIASLKRTFPQMRDATKRAQIGRFMESDMKYSMEPSRDWHKFRSAVSLWQLGFSPAAAFINLTQTPVFTMPYFAGIYGQRANMLLTSVVKSTKRAIQYSPAQADPQFAATRQLLIQMGKLETGAAPELGAYAEGGNLLGSIAGTAAQRKWRSFMRTSMWMFQQAERVNREIVLGLGWELSKDPTHPHLQEIESQYQMEILRLAATTVDVDGVPVRLTYDTAVRLISIREAISRTQFEYSRDYRPPFLRSPLASSFLVFFGYVQSALYAFGNNPGTLQLFLTFAFLFGAMGLPGAEDLEEVLNAVARKLFGKDFSLEDKARELVRELTEGTVFDETGPDLLLHGISRYGFGLGLLQEGLGTPQFDASANGSMGRVVPGLAETARALGRGDDWKSVTGELVKESAGAGFGQLFPMIQFLGSVASGDILSGDWKKWEAVMPRAVKAMSKAGRYYVEGEEHGKSGATIAEFDIRDPDDLATIVAQGLGFTPTQVSMKWDLIIKQQDQLKFYQNRKSALMLQFTEAVRLKDPESKQEVIKSIQAYNRELKALGLQSMGITPDGLKQSAKQRAVAARKQELGIPTQTTATPLYRKVEELFPGVEKVK